MAPGEIDRLWRAFQAAPATPAFHELVRALIAAGRHGDAVRVCEMGLPHHGGEARAYLALGLALRGVGRVEEAQAAMVRAVKLDPADAACARALGELLLARGEPRRAREMFAHALRHSPGDITLRELLERASAAAGLPALPDPVDAAARATPVPVVRPARVDASREPTFEILESVDVLASDPADGPTSMRTIPAALEVALRAELTLSGLPVPGPSASPARRTPPPAARPGGLASPPRAPAPARPAPAPVAPLLPADPGREITDEISAQDIIVEPDPRGRGVLHSGPMDVRSVPGLGREPARGRGRLALWIAVVLVVLGVGGAAGAWFLARARRAERVVTARRSAEAALATGDAEGYRTAVRLFDRALRDAPEDAELQDRAVLAGSLALLEAGAGTATKVEAALPPLRETEDADAARAALRLALGDYAGADEILRKAPGPRAGAVLPYLGALLAARRGDGDARERLEAVAGRFPHHVPTRVALAELDLVLGHAERANGEAEHARQAQPASLRPVVVSVLAQAHGGDPAAILGLVDGLAGRTGRASACDRLLLGAARGLALARLGRAPDARTALVGAGPAACADPMALVVWARVASAAGATAPALEAIERVRRLAPASLPVRTLAASILVDAGRGPEAEQLLTGAGGSSDEVDLLLARAAIASRQDVRAIPILQRLVARAPERADARMLLLRARVRVGDAAAADEVKALEGAHSDDPAVLLAAAEVALVGRDPAGAIERLQRVVARAPSAEAYFRLGQALRLSARFGEAVEAFRAAFALSPEYADALEAAASLELARGRLDDAQALAVRLERAPGGLVPAALLRAEIDLSRGDPAASLARLDTLPAAEAPARRVTLLRARALARRGDIDRAMQEVRPLVLDRRDAEALAVRGEIRRARPTERVGAAEDFDDALIADPELPEALLGRLEIALDRDEGGMVDSLVDRAVAALQTRLRPPAAHARLLVIRAREALRAGRRHRAEAESLLTVATETAPLHAEGWFWLGKVVGPEQARGRAALQRFLDLQATGPLADEARRLMR